MIGIIPLSCQLFHAFMLSSVIKYIFIEHLLCLGHHDEDTAVSRTGKLPRHVGLAFYCKETDSNKLTNVIVHLFFN